MTAADYATARREAESALNRWDSLPVTHRYDYEAAEVIRALRSLLAAEREKLAAAGSCEDGFTSHFATCPEAATHRRPR